MRGVLAALAALLLLTACAAAPAEMNAPADGGVPAPGAPAQPTGGAEAPDPVFTWTVTDGITFSPLQEIYPVGTERITVVLENRTDLELTYGEGYAFQQYTAGQWRDVDRRAYEGWRDVAWILQPHSAQSFTVDAQPLEEGLYRVIGQDMRLWPLEETVPAWQVEFRVSAEGRPEPDYGLLIPDQPVSGLETIPVLFLNATGQEGYVLDIPHLERREADRWVEVPYREQVGFCGTPSTLYPAGRIWSEEPSVLWGALTPGLYRLSYQVGPTFATEETVSAEFTVERPEICAYPLADPA